MKPQAFQPGELRDEYDQIIRAGAYGKKTPFVNSDNSAILDYIINNFDALYAQIPNGRAYVKSVNNITPDSNGNVTVNVGSGGGTGTNITVDSALSSTSTNPVQNKVLYAVLNNKLDKNGTATYAARDSSGNIISSTYARKTDLNSYVKSINNMKPDSAGNVNISSSGGGSNITVDFTLDSTSSNAIANKAVYAALNNKLDKTGTAAAATKATQDSYGNVIVTTYARKSDLSGYVKTINNQEPDANGNINISTGGAGTGTNITVDSTLSSTSNNPIANKAVYAAVNNKLDKTGIAAYATRDGSGNVIINTYATKNELSGCVKSINNITPDSSGNVNISTSGGGANITVDTVLSANSANAIANKAVYNALSGKLGVTDTAEYAKKDAAGNVIVDTYAKKADISGVVKSVNGTTPDSNGNVNISAGGGDGVSTSVANNWSAQQNFQHLKFSFENFATSRISGTYDSPATSVATYNVTGALTLDMSTLVGMISNGDTSIFTAYIASNGSYALSITNAGTLKYAGSAADLAITASGLLLNIFLTKNPSGVVTSIAQATKLSRGA
ncbi:hypothetical protein [Phascolarctobacterium succinatutens]|uniref:hypothetical protein n=1 Tax=Phascolarctobacterium succinatutens TaxID=626940 RepID=UPI002E79C188|nr:hypothetical protein [Phascolarctobacterium succinatutens]MEE0508934.1 hypothetical protein [Phascolarctobacterium succinatutens]